MWVEEPMSRDDHLLSLKNLTETELGTPSHTHADDISEEDSNGEPIYMSVEATKRMHCELLVMRMKYVRERLEAMMSAPKRRGVRFYPLRQYTLKYGSPYLQNNKELGHTVGIVDGIRGVLVPREGRRCDYVIPTASC